MAEVERHKAEFERAHATGVAEVAAWQAWCDMVAAQTFGRLQSGIRALETHGREIESRPASRHRAQAGSRKAAPRKTEDQAGAATETQERDSPLLDLSDQAVKKLLKTAKARGYVTYDELNSVLPSEEVSSEQIEDTMAMLSEMGINVVETRGEPRSRAAAADEPEEEEAAARSSRRPCPRRPAPAPSRPTAPTIPCACTCARWARSSCCRARARSPSPSASRPAATR